MEESLRKALHLVRNWFESRGEAGLRIDALHHYWTRADGIRSRMLLTIPSAGLELPSSLQDAAKTTSQLMAMEAFYGLLYVVVEGYQQLELHDNAIDKLLAEEELLRLLRRFRNVIFHFQRNPLDARLSDFLQAPSSGEWISQFYAAFRTFLEREIPVKELLVR